MPASDLASIVTISPASFVILSRVHLHPSLCSHCSTPFPTESTGVCGYQMAAQHLKSDNASVQTAAMAFFEEIFSTAKVGRLICCVLHFHCFLTCLGYFVIQVHGPDHSTVANLVTRLFKQRDSSAPTKSMASFAVPGAASARAKFKRASANSPAKTGLDQHPLILALRAHPYKLVATLSWICTTHEEAVRDVFKRDVPV